MTQAPAANSKIPTESPQPTPRRAVKSPGRPRKKLGHFLAAGTYGHRGELMACTAAYSGLRWGELMALTIQQIDQAARVIAVDRKVVEVAGRLYLPLGHFQEA